MIQDIKSEVSIPVGTFGQLIREAAAFEVLTRYIDEVLERGIETFDKDAYNCITSVGYDAW